LFVYRVTTPVTEFKENMASGVTVVLVSIIEYVKAGHAVTDLVQPGVVTTVVSKSVYMS
jgi:urease gamma subunit